jgi:hypothetical protein
MAKRHLKKSSRRKQKIYKMKGCSKKNWKNKSYLGGSADINLAYTGSKTPSVPNPFLAYTGKGGRNINAADKTLPNTGPLNQGLGTPFLNPINPQKGGNCNCGVPMVGGGGMLDDGDYLYQGREIGTYIGNYNYNELNDVFYMFKNKEGGITHLRPEDTKDLKKVTSDEKNMVGGNPGIPYPNGLVGAPWTPSPAGWPGVDGVQGGRNYIAPNLYKTDVQTAMISTGANPPFSIGGRKCVKKNATRKRSQKGGTATNFLAQDLINLGRQFNYGLGSAYNALTGYSAPTNPMPWKGQLPNTPNLSTFRATAL